MKHAINVLYENLDFQRRKLETMVKVLEPELQLRIQEKIKELEVAISVLRKNNISKD